MTAVMIEHVLRCVAALKECDRELPADLPEFSRELYASSNQVSMRRARKQTLLRDMEFARDILATALNGA